MTSEANLSLELGDDVNRSTEFDPTCYTDTDDYFFSLSNTVYMTTSSICVVIGLLGNALSITVFSSARTSCISSNVYLLALAISDGCYLITVFLSKTLTFLKCWGYISRSADIVNSSPFACVFVQYLSDLLSDFSTCLILAFTVERCVAVYLPTQWKELCTVVRARIASAAIFTAVAIMICPHHVMFIGLYRDPDICAVIMAHESLFTVMYFAESLLFRILPVVAIALLNVGIIIRIGRISREKNRLKKTVKHDHMQMTITLTIVSTTYIVLHIPVLVHFVVTKLYRSGLVTMTLRTIFITQNYARSMYVAGFAVNFFLYTVGGRVFREELLRSLGCRQMSTREKKRSKVSQSAMSVFHHMTSPATN